MRRSRITISILALTMLACSGSDFGVRATGGAAGASGGGAGGATGGAAGTSGAPSGGSAGVMQALDGGNGATGGGGGRGSPLTCTEMGSAYAKALALTKNCTAMAGAQCTKSVPNQLACPCPTFVNPTNATALNELESLEAAWNASICDEEVSCTAGCPTPSGASCVASSGSGPGKCTDSL